ncbi:hypothetical protein ACU8KH_04999 [Lachancea thermotolerans]
MPGWDNSLRAQESTASVSVSSYFCSRYVVDFYGMIELCNIESSSEFQSERGRDLLYSLIFEATRIPG